MSSLSKNEQFILFSHSFVRPFIHLLLSNFELKTKPNFFWVFRIKCNSKSLVTLLNITKLFYYTKWTKLMFLFMSSVYNKIQVTV